ncbi:MAG: DUF1641 domain-containing protein [Syntrophobacteraceae bacterium]|jgi:uncharacterized protein YjgD (DUF1641 family)
MSKEDMILERLDRIEAQLAPLSASARSMKEFKEDISPLVNQSVQVLIRELATVDSSFQLEDLFALIKAVLRNTRNLTFSLNQLGNLSDFLFTIEPLLKSTVPTFIKYLDELEQRGVFRILNAMLGVRSKMAAAYTPEDIDKIGDGLVVLFGLAEKLRHPQAREFLETLAELPAEVDLSECKPLGPIGLLSACRASEVKDGLGVIIELTKAMGKFKGEPRMNADRHRLRD